MPTLQQGRIIWATMPDPSGRNPKDRPGVIVTATDEIDPDGQIVIAAITGTIPIPVPPTFVVLPWQRGGHPKTGLKKRCAAACEWLIAISPHDIKDYSGVVPDACLLEILRRLPEIQR